MFEALRKDLERTPFTTDKQQIIPRLVSLLKKAVKQEGRVGIGFSGGVDSSTIALLSTNFQLYTVGLERSDDLRWAQDLAKKQHWPLTVRVLSLQEAEDAITTVVNLFKTDHVPLNATTVGVGCVVYCILELAKKDGISVVLGGLGAEEIFAGYRRHVDYGKDYSRETIQQRLWEGLQHMETRDLARDLCLARHFGITLVAPFLDPDLVRYAMQIDPLLKITPQQKKIIFRDVAKSLGLPEDVAERKKVAAQYGSRFDHVLAQLAKKHGYKYKREYLQSL